MQFLAEHEFESLVGIADQLCTIGMGNFAKGDIGCFSNYPDDFQKLYFDNGWMQVDPVVRACAPRASVFEWPDISQDHGPVMIAANDFGMKTGVSMSSQIAGNGLIVSYAGNKALTEAARDEAAKLLHRVHLDKLAERAMILTDEQRELVALFAHGMRASRVAHYFEIGEDAIKLRKRRIETLLGVNNFLAVVHVCAVAGVTTNL